MSAGPEARAEAVRPISLGELFWLFLRGGLAFGGGVSIAAVLEQELVKRNIVTRQEFLATYAIGRIVPSGTMTALAIEYGYRLHGVSGTLVALFALLTPGFVAAVLFTEIYRHWHGPTFVQILQVTLLPSAVALMVRAAFQLGQDVLKPKPEILIALAAFIATFAFGVDPLIALAAGGAIGALAFGREHVVEVAK